MTPAKKPQTAIPSINADLVPERNEAEVLPYIVRICDVNGHLLFCYNTRTDSLEITGSRAGERQTKYQLPLSKLRSAGLAGIYSEPVKELQFTEVPAPDYSGETIIIASATTTAINTKEKQEEE